MNSPENYKYTIVINQKAFIDLGIKVSYEEAALFYYIIGLCTNKNERIESERINGYTWIDYGKIIKDMPLLKSKTKTPIADKVKKLQALGLIETKNIGTGTRSKKYFKLTSKSDIFIIQDDSLIKFKNYETFLRFGMNEARAREIASNENFLRVKLRELKRAATADGIRNKAAYINEMYETFNGVLGI